MKSALSRHTRQAIAEEELAKRLNEAEQAVQSYADTHASFKNALELSGLSVKDFSAILASQDVDFEEAAKAIEQYSSTAASGFSKISDSSATRSMPSTRRSPPT